MKKKLKKELEEIFLHYSRIKIDDIDKWKAKDKKKRNQVINISFVADFKEEKKQKPEFVYCNYDYDEGKQFTKGMLYKVIIESRDRFEVYDDKGEENGHNKQYLRPATPAEIEAHKLGFHVGDEVWLNEKSNFNHKTSFIITEIGYNFGKKGIMSAKFRKEDSLIYEYIDCLTKTPPKQPIFQIDGKDMFEGDEYWFIDKINNWTLQQNKLNNESVYYKQETSKHRIELTKQDALNYVLEEEKRRFEGKKYNFGKNTCTHIYSGNLKFISKNNEYTALSDSGAILWDEKNGWIAEPIKEPKLMLGEWPVEIVKICPNCMSEKTANDYIHCAGCDEKRSFESDEVIIKVKDGQVTEEEWLSWYNFIKIAIDMSLGMDIITGRLGVYSGTYYKKDRTFIIGCIGKNDTKRATLEQIEAITKELIK